LPEEYNVGTQTEVEENQEKMTDRMKINVFDGKDYSIWKKRILMYLKWKKCDEAALIKDKPALTEQINWDEKNMKAINYIYCSISNNQLEFVSDEVTAFDIMKKFDQLYLKESSALQICVRNKSDKMKLKDYEKSSSFFTDLKKIINELKNDEGKVDERKKLNYMLSIMPDSLCYVGDLVDDIKDEDIRCEFLKNKINSWEARIQGKNKKSSAFKVEYNSSKTYYRCGKPSYFKKDYRNPWMNTFYILNNT